MEWLPLNWIRPKFPLTITSCVNWWYVLHRYVCCASECDILMINNSPLGSIWNFPSEKRDWKYLFILIINMVYTCCSISIQCYYYSILNGIPAKLLLFSARFSLYYFMDMPTKSKQCNQRVWFHKLIELLKNQLET